LTIPPGTAQSIRLEARVARGRLEPQRLVNTRPAQVARALAGSALDEVPRLLALLLPVCGQAHAVAGLGAIETALGIAVSPAQAAARRVLVLAEQASALAWRTLVDWAALLDEPARPRPLAELRRLRSELTAALYGHERWDRIGGATLRPDSERARRAAQAIGAQLRALLPEVPDPTSPLESVYAALRAGRSIPARAFAQASDPRLARYGEHSLPFLAARDAAWFDARLAARPDFGDAPTVEGTPAEVGALAEPRHASVAQACAQWGAGLAARVLAQALELATLPAKLEAAAAAVAADLPAACDWRGRGAGTGIAATTRGVLAHHIACKNGRVLRARSVAPTEWNFHPAGPFVAALAAAPAVGEPLQAARLLAASLDPCVPFEIVATGADAGLS
jgi:coenzyme F420-reducing hydrogenase alpha subunit